MEGGLTPHEAVLDWDLNPRSSVGKTMVRWDTWFSLPRWQTVPPAKALPVREPVGVVVAEKKVEVSGIAKISQLPLVGCRIDG
jgi:hypothetical protein